MAMAAAGSWGTTGRRLRLATRGSTAQSSRTAVALQVGSFDAVDTVARRGLASHCPPWKTRGLRAWPVIIMAGNGMRRTLESTERVVRARRGAVGAKADTPMAQARAMRTEANFIVVF